MLANIFFLAHAVLPHSHHDGIVCFSVESETQDCNCCHTHDDLDQCCSQHESKNHHHHDHSEDCDLKKAVFRQADNLHEDIVPCADCLSLLYAIYSLNEFYTDAAEFGQWLEQKPYLITYTPPFVGSIRSLRAPPCILFLG